MRKLTVALLALPVVALVYLSVGLRRSRLPRVVLALIVAVALGMGAAGVQAPAGITAVPPSTPAPVLDAALATRIETGESPAAAITLHFPGRMDLSSVATLLDVEPPTPVQLVWTPDGTELTVRPVGSWTPGALHTITIGAGALDATGRPIASAIRAVFLTRPATQAAIAVTQLAGRKAALSTAFTIHFDRAIDDRTLAIQIDPPVEGTFEPLPPGEEGVGYRFSPAEPLAPGTTYRVTLPPTVLDVDGSAVAPVAPLEIQTGDEPGVVRFRPADKTADVALAATLSVRFTEAMDRASTGAAWQVTADGNAVSGAISWAEGDTVLVFQPAAAFTYGQTVVMTVGTGARSRAGVALAAPISGTFTTAAKKVAATTAPSTGAPGTGGGTVGAGSWAAVETYYLGLMNCTRTGGWVQGNGTCVGGGSGPTAALWIDAGITSAVSRPYAKMEAEGNLCSHFINGTPGDRLAAAGYTSYIWAENLGCQNGVDPYWSMLDTHLYFQSEKSSNGGHYVNMMNPKYDRVGLAVWVASGRVRLVVDFYRPL